MTNIDVSEKYREFYKRMRESHVSVDAVGMKFDDDYVMFWAEQPLMKRHAFILFSERDDFDLLEIGFGLGVFFREACIYHPRSYTIIEAHPSVCKEAKSVISSIPKGNTKVEIRNQLWQESLSKLNKFDVVMVDICSPPGQRDNDFCVIAEEVSAHHLKPGGAFSFVQIGSLSDRRKKILERYFREISIEIVFISNMPPEWTKLSSDFSIAVAYI